MKPYSIVLAMFGILGAGKHVLANMSQNYEEPKYHQDQAYHNQGYEQPHYDQGYDGNSGYGVQAYHHEGYGHDPYYGYDHKGQESGLFSNYDRDDWVWVIFSIVIL